jgi:hypothetical protein
VAFDHPDAREAKPYLPNPLRDLYDDPLSVEPTLVSDNRCGVLVEVTLLAAG